MSVWVLIEHGDGGLYALAHSRDCVADAAMIRARVDAEPDDVLLLAQVEHGEDGVLRWRVGAIHDGYDDGVFSEGIAYEMEVVGRVTAHEAFMGLTSDHLYADCPRLTSELPELDRHYGPHPRKLAGKVDPLGTDICKTCLRKWKLRNDAREDA